MGVRPHGAVLQRSQVVARVATRVVGDARVAVGIIGRIGRSTAGAPVHAAEIGQDEVALVGGSPGGAEDRGELRVVVGFLLAAIANQPAGGSRRAAGVGDDAADRGLRGCVLLCLLVHIVPFRFAVSSCTVAVDPSGTGAARVPFTPSLAG